ncbi:MAG: SPOR domain-containing protein [Pseudomonadota bacterium]
MATRRKSGGKKGRFRGLWLVLIGIAVGVAVVYGWQLISKSIDRRGGLGNLIEAGRHRDPPKTTAGERRETKADKPAARTKPHFEFYTLLENEKVLPDRRVREEPVRTANRAVTYVLQAGSFASFEDADQLKARLALSGLIAHIQKVEVRGKVYHRVRLGPYQQIDQLDAVGDQLKQLGIRALRLEIRPGAG